MLINYNNFTFPRLRIALTACVYASLCSFVLMNRLDNQVYGCMISQSRFDFLFLLLVAISFRLLETYEIYKNDQGLKL